MKGSDTEPLLPGGVRRVVVVDYSRLPFWWPCLLTAALFGCAAMGTSVGITSWVLEDPARASFYQDDWWVCWLVFLVLLIITLPLLLVSALLINALKGTIGLRGAFPVWATLLLVSNVLSATFWGLFFATYPFSWMLQMQIYAAFQAAALLAYAFLGFTLQWLPIFGGYHWLGGFAATVLSACVASSAMTASFVIVGYPDSRDGAGLWRPRLCFWLYIFLFGMGPIQQISQLGASAASFEPGA